MPVKPMRRPFLQNNRLLWAFLLVLGLGVGVQAQSLVNTAHVVDSAGGASQSSTYSNISAIGQPFGFDENSSATYVNKGGFLHGGGGGGGAVVVVDSDGDGLTDSDETNIHKTDPNNPDTDGDGFNDGDEVAAGTNPNVPALKDGLVLHYTFDQDSIISQPDRIKDESGNGRRGILRNQNREFTANRYGTPGSAIVMGNGNVNRASTAVEFIGAGPDPMLPSEINDEHTVSFWFYLSQDHITHNQVLFEFFDMETVVDQLEAFEFIVNGKGKRFHWENGAGARSGGGTNMPIQFKQWHHVSLVLGGEWLGSEGKKEITLLLDGKRVGGFSNHALELWNVNFGNKNLRIGASKLDANSGFFAGLMDDFRIYDRALSGAEIKLLINADKPTVDLESGLIAYYPFNGNANDESGNGNHGRLGEGAYLGEDRFGEAEKAYYFDGNDDTVIIDHTDDLNFGNKEPMTISIWIMRMWQRSHNQTITDIDILGKRANYMFSFGLSHHNLDIGGAGRHPNGASGAFEGLSYSGPFADSALPENKYQHLVFTFDSSMGRMYLDGELVTANEMQLGDPSETPLVLGGQLSRGRRFRGVLDDIRIYNRALNQEEVDELYELEKATIDLTDSDSDGLTDFDETNIHKTDPTLPDTDSDGLTDGDEVNIHKTDPTLADTDSDGLSDGEEINEHNTNPLIADTDGDGLTDGDEVNIHKTDPLVVDTDSDGLTDGDEVNIHKTDPLLADTDTDGLTDGDEVNKYGTDPLDADSDDDSFNDGAEVAAGTDPNDNNSSPTVDSDSDGLTDIAEVDIHKTDPNLPDTDSDGLTDGDEVNKYKTNPLVADTDEDGLTDGDEVNKYKTDPLLADTDGDGLTDGDEINIYKTNPRLADTDGDGLSDGDEVNIYKTNPLVADTDGDGLSDGLEINRHKTDPLVVDTDKDESNDGDEVAAGTDPNDPDDFPINVVAPVITVPPSTVFAQLGRNVIFRVEARGVPIAYQWFKTGQPIAGAKANLLRLYEVSDDDVGVYTVEVSNQAGKVVSFPAFLKIVKAPPVFSEIPTRFDLVYEAGETIILDPKIETEGPTTYQWDKDGNDLPDETDPILIIHDVKDEDAGDYTVDATNLAGKTVSETMRVSVVDESKIGTHVENNFNKASGIIHSSPAVGRDDTIWDGTIYYSTIGQSPQLYAHQPNGVNKWIEPFDSPLRGSPAIDGNGIIYVLEDAGVLHAVSPIDGKKLWQYKLTGEYADASGEDDKYHISPAITEDNTVIFGWFNGTVYAVKDKNLVWEFAIEEPFYSSPSIGPDGTVYIGSSTGDLYAINPANGEEVWTKPFPSGGLMHTRPAIDAKGDIYFGSYSGIFYALKPNGAWKWAFETEQAIWSSAVIRGDGTVYFGADDGKFYALDSETGEVKWEYKINTNFQKSTSAALGLDGSIYFSLTDNNFYAISRIGKKVWSVRLNPEDGDSASFSSPALLDDGKIFVGAQDGASKGQLNVIQGGSPIDNESPWPSFGGDLQNTGRVMVKRTDADSFKAKLRVIEASGENVKIQITGDAFETYKLQYSSDLKEWKVVPDLQSITTNFRGKADFNQTPTPDSGPVFYRLMNE